MPRGEGCKHCNAKTLLSFDTTTICPQMRRGHPCIYCYVAASREDTFRAKAVIYDDEYDGWVLRMRPETVQRLRDMGGLRMFSFGDYLRRHRKEIKKFLDDCQVRELPVKAITKIVQFVYDWHDHSAIQVINVCVDDFKGRQGRSPISMSVAMKLRERYRKVRVRAVVLSEEELKKFGGDLRVDILTLNHGNNGFHQFSMEEHEAAAAKYPNRVCCELKVCDGCTVLCGTRRRRRLKKKRRA